jgi:hypothetical protein
MSILFHDAFAYFVFGLILEGRKNCRGRIYATREGLINQAPTNLRTLDLEMRSQFIARSLGEDPCYANPPVQKNWLTIIPKIFMNPTTSSSLMTLLLKNYLPPTGNREPFTVNCLP